MKDINVVLAQKREELLRCRIDLHCLKVVIRLLREPRDWAERTEKPSSSAEEENVL
jgi:hypothetical protein